LPPSLPVSVCSRTFELPDSQKSRQLWWRWSSVLCSSPNPAIRLKSTFVMPRVSNSTLAVPSPAPTASRRPPPYNASDAPTRPATTELPVPNSPGKTQIDDPAAPVLPGARDDCRPLRELPNCY
jgi:hypothetical protein